MCGNKPNLKLVTDCDGQAPEVTCDCCVKCCNDDTICTDEEYLAQTDPLWESRYRRTIYNFSDDFRYAR